MNRPSLRGFSLVELMVALTGGLFVSVIVFAMARQGTRFYQQETRVAEATLAATIGMQRLRADIGRAGYMSSAFVGNINDSDPNLCMSYAGANQLLLKNMRSIQIEQNGSLGATTDPGKAGIKTDIIQLSGAYQNSDRFIAGYLQKLNGTQYVPLQPNIGALARLRYVTLTLADRTSLLASLFPAGRLLRVVNQYGRVAYGLINSTSPTGDPTNSLPTILLKADPDIPMQGGANAVCTFSGVGVEVNVVNFYRYRIADLKGDAIYKSTFGQLFSTLSDANPANAHRTELIREELDPTTGSTFATDPPTPPEIVAEYAVDLHFEGLVTPPVGAGQTSLTMTKTEGALYAIAKGDPTGQPQRIRSIRARLSVRSREADRSSNVPSSMTGLYRIAVGDTANTFARVRTVQTDIAIPNHFGLVR
jgi:hypothetical protein